MTTPEGRIKRKISSALAQWEGIYRYMPVPTGRGETTLDYLILVNGQFLGIEAKAPGKKPTARQLMTIADITAAGGTCLVIDGDLKELNAFLKTYTKRKATPMCEAKGCP